VVATIVPRLIPNELGGADANLDASVITTMDPS